MFTVNNFFNNDDIKILDQKGPFRVVEYQRDLSVMPSDAMMAYYCNEMNVRKRQVACDVGMSNVTVQAGAMQWTVGNVNATTGVKGVGDLLGKALRGSVTGESAIKPEYTGSGLLVRNPPTSTSSCWTPPSGAAPSSSMTACSWPASPSSSTRL